MTHAPSVADLIGVDDDKFNCICDCVDVDKELGTFVRYWRYSAADAKSSHRPLIVALHGGPAFTHNYILPLKLLALHGYDVLFYDQAGCGRSWRAESDENIPTALLTVQYYVDELRCVIDKVVKKHDYYVYGSSWGTALAAEFAVAHHNDVHLRGLLLDGAFVDSQYYIKTQWSDVLKPNVSSFTLQRLAELEASNAHTSEEYGEIERLLSSYFTMRCRPTPQCWHDALEQQNKVIYDAMQGPSEFTIGGVLKHWSIIDRVDVVRCPVFVLAGEYDTMSRACQQQVVDAFPHAWPLVTVARAAHCKLIDEPRACVDAMRNFLDTIEAVRPSK